MGQIDIDFRYWENGRSFSLPSWGKHFLEIGAEVSQKYDAQKRLVTALAVPTRSYAAILVASGAVITKVKTTHGNPPGSNVSHFRMLCSLPQGTSVILTEGQKTFKGILVGTKKEEDDGHSHIGVQIQNSKSGALTAWLPIETSQKVQVSPSAWPTLPAKPEAVKNISTTKAEFVSRLFQGRDLVNLVTGSRLDCVILGNVGQLLQEATATKLSVGSRGSETATGSLQDILRIRKLNKNNEAFRSDIFPVNAKEQPRISEEMPPQLVIFDGAAGFLKWRHNWSQCNSVVILDRTEPRFSEAVQAVNEEYTTRISDGELQLGDSLPKSIEQVAYTVAR